LRRWNRRHSDAAAAAVAVGAAVVVAEVVVAVGVCLEAVAACRALRQVDRHRLAVLRLVLRAVQPARRRVLPAEGHVHQWRADRGGLERRLGLV